MRPSYFGEAFGQFRNRYPQRISLLCYKEDMKMSDVFVGWEKNVIAIMGTRVCNYP